MVKKNGQKKFDLDLNRNSVNMWFPKVSKNDIISLRTAMDGGMPMRLDSASISQTTQPGGERASAKHQVQNIKFLFDESLQQKTEYRRR
jgi:hypothetical protein